jgi:recombinational DNA repair protein (RecF pathway)
MLKLYTREFGMILAKASSLRKSTKMRPHIQVGREVFVTLVKGKEIYRLAGVVERHVFVNSRQVSACVVASLSKYIQGEQKNIKLYDRMVSYIHIGDSEARAIRLAIHADILIMLGYLNIEDLGLEKQGYIQSDAIGFYLHVTLNKKNIVHNVAKASEASML